MPDRRRRTSGTTRGPSPHFIPGTNAIESLNYQLRKIIKNRGHFPNDDAVIKLLWLAIRDIEDKRARERAKEAGRPKNQRTAPAKLVEGAQVQGWNAAYGALSLAFPGRLEVTL
jgi:putative transposase